MIEPRYATLRTFFTDRVFRIPRYQRFYSWQTKQRDALFSDVRKLAERDDDDHHFMATVVCHRTDQVETVGAAEYRLYDVVDGQQRITTLVLILKSVQISLSQTGESAEECENVRKLLVKPDGNLVLLQMNNANQHMFNAFLRDGAVPELSSVQTHADRALAKGIGECQGFVGRWRDENGDVLSLLRLVLNRLGFVVYDTDNERIVYTLFEVLNSRGLPVDELDKCKSALMGRAYELAQSPGAAEAAVAALHDIWGSIYRVIGDVRVPGQQIVRVTATLRHGPFRGKPQSADKAIELLRSECENPEHPEQVSSSILDVTRKLVDLEKNVFLAPVTRVLQARILAVALQSAAFLNETEMQRVMEQWERVTFRVFGLFGKDARSKVGEYIRLAESVMSRSEGASRYSELMGSLRDLGMDHPIDMAVEEGLVGKNIYEDSPAVCRYVLWRYEEHLARMAGEGATVDEQVRRAIWQARAADTIEHVFPQSPAPGGAWEGKMRTPDGEDEAIEDHVHRIGNLLLLPSSLNEEAKQRGFAEKKTVYERHNLRMVGEVLSAQDWDLNEIQRREERIVQWAREAWDDLHVD